MEPSSVDWGFYIAAVRVETTAEPGVFSADPGPGGDVTAAASLIASPTAVPGAVSGAAVRSVDRPALLLLAAWLLATAVPVAGAGPVGRFGVVRHLMLLAAAVAALLASWELARLARQPATRARAAAAVLLASFAAWLPLVAVPALYAELPLVAAGLAGARAGAFAPMHDAAVVRWELALFGPLLGGSPSTVLAERAPWTPLSELLHLAYLAYYAIIYVPPALLWWEAAWRRGRRGRRGGVAARGVISGAASPGVISGAASPRAAYDASAFTVLLAFVLCYAVFAVFPVQGPWYTWGTGGARGLPLAGPVRAFVQGLLVAGSSRGTAFPSSHVAVSVAQAVALGRVAPRLAWVVGPTTALLALGAVYGGYHYGVDAIAGAVVGAGAGWAGPRVVEWWRGR